MKNVLVYSMAKHDDGKVIKRTYFEVNLYLPNEHGITLKINSYNDMIDLFEALKKCENIVFR